MYQHEDIEYFLTVCRNQPGDEKENATAKRVYGKGFNKVDAPILTPLAEFYRRNKFLYRSDLQTLSRRIRKYPAQQGECPLQLQANSFAASISDLDEVYFETCNRQTMGYSNSKAFTPGLPIKSYSTQRRNASLSFSTIYDHTSNWECNPE